MIAFKAEVELQRDGDGDVWIRLGPFLGINLSAAAKGPIMSKRLNEWLMSVSEGGRP